MMRAPTFLVLMAMMATGARVSGQCTNNNTLNNAPATPPCPGSIIVNCISGGQYVIVNVVAGNLYTFSTCGGALWDTQITLYNNAGGGSLGYNDDGCGFFSVLSTLTWTATFTGQLRVLVDQYDCLHNASCANLTITCIPNDHCANAIPIGNGITPFSTVGTTAGADITSCTTNDTRDIWFVYEATCTGTATVSTCSMAGYDTALSIWSGCSGTQLACNDDAAGCGAGSTTTFPVTAGTSYWIRVSGYDGATGTGNLGINCSGTSGSGGCEPGIGGGGVSGSGSIQVQQGLSPAQLVTDVFLGDCLTASNIQFTGSTAAIGTFSNGWGIGIGSGIVLTTGSATLAAGPNSSASAGQDNFLPGNPLLDALVPGYGTYDASVLRFTFVPQTEQVTFTYVFASEEYPEWVCDDYNDVFGFFVSGPGYAPNTNIATIPGSFAPVTIDIVNNVGGCGPYYPAFYVSNAGGTHNQYDGFTRPLTTCINTIPCETYTIIIAIADAGDGLYDSAVFLEAESFTAGVDMGITATEQGGATSTAENCGEDGCFVFTLEHALDQDLTLNYLLEHIGNGEFVQDPLPISVTFPAGTTEASICLSAIDGSLGTSLNSVTITLDTSQDPILGCSCENEIITTTLYFCDPDNYLPVTWLDFQARTINAEREVLCSWWTGSELNSDHFTVERSADVEHWYDIGTLAGAGTTSTPQSYLFIDRSPLSGMAYYRIRQTDLDGTTDRSIIRPVQRGTLPGFSVRPAPDRNTFQLQGHEGGVLLLYDLSGRHVPFTLRPNGELILHAAASGWYLAELRRGTGSERVRFFAQ